MFINQFWFQRLFNSHCQRHRSQLHNRDTKLTHGDSTDIYKKHLNNVGPIRYCEPPLHCQSPGVASRTPAIAIAQAACDVHNDDDDDDDNAWQRGPLWPHGMGPNTVIPSPEYWLSDWHHYSGACSGACSNVLLLRPLWKFIANFTYFYSRRNTSSYSTRISRTSVNRASTQALGLPQCMPWLS